ncbi:hypothetical protein D3C81_749540 [compost metagenome]
MAELVRDERGVHPSHKAHGCVGVARVVLTTFTDAQRCERELEGRDCTTWRNDPHPAFSRLKHKRTARGGRTLLERLPVWPRRSRAAPGVPAPRFAHAPFRGADISLRWLALTGAPTEFSVHLSALFFCFCLARIARFEAQFFGVVVDIKTARYGCGVEAYPQSERLFFDGHSRNDNKS